MTRRRRSPARTSTAGANDAYNTWRMMLRRCSDPRTKGYEHYGARGITVCDRWHQFGAFISDVGPRPPGTRLARLDIHGNYEPGNVRWASATAANRKKSDSRTVTVNGQPVPLIEAARTHGIAYNTLHSRLRRGWSTERALAKPSAPRPATQDAA